jgi:hypothetical protein
MKLQGKIQENIAGRNFSLTPITLTIGVIYLISTNKNSQINDTCSQGYWCQTKIPSCNIFLNFALQFHFETFLHFSFFTKSFPEILYLTITLTNNSYINQVIINITGFDGGPSLSYLHLLLVSKQKRSFWNAKTKSFFNLTLFEGGPQCQTKNFRKGLQEGAWRKNTDRKGGNLGKKGGTYDENAHIIMYTLYMLQI